MNTGKKVLCVRIHVPDAAPATELSIGSTYTVEKEMNDTEFPDWVRKVWLPMPGRWYWLVGFNYWYHSSLFADLPVAEEEYISVSEQVGRTAIARFNKLQNR